MPTPGTVNSYGETWDGQQWQASGASADTSVPQYHPGLADTPASAFVSELGRTAKEAAIGVAKSPWDMLQSVLHPVDTVTGMGHAIAHPLDTIKAIGDNPRAGGSLLGQMLLAPKIPGLAEGAPGVVGRGLGAVGRGMEAAGTSQVAQTAGRFGAMEAALRLDPKGIAIAAAPAILKYGGQGAQRLGSSLEGLTSFARGTAPVEAPHPVLSVAERAQLTKQGLSPEAIARFEASQAPKPTPPTPRVRQSSSSGPSGNEMDQPLDPGKLWPYQSDAIQAGRSPASRLATASAGTKPPDLMNEYLASTAGPAKDFTMGGTKYSADASGSHVAVPPSPIEQFLASDTPARTGGEGRTTGSFPEGPNSLSNVTAGPSDNGGPNVTAGPSDNWGPNLDTQLPTPRAVSDLAARSAERFGKSYQSETTSLPGDTPYVMRPDGPPVTEADALALNAELQALGKTRSSTQGSLAGLQKVTGR